MSDPKINILMRKWSGIRTNVVHMEDTLLKLMENPQSTPEQLAMAAKLYTSVTQKLTDCANAIDNYLYRGIKPKPVHMMSCRAFSTGVEKLCNCKDWQGV